MKKPYYIDDSLESNQFPYCIQCKDPVSGETGCFLYDRIKRISGEGLHAIGPVFVDQVAMFAHYHAIGIKPVFLIERKA